MDQVDIGSGRSTRASNTQGSASEEPGSSVSVKSENHLQSSHPIEYEGGDTS